MYPLSYRSFGFISSGFKLKFPTLSGFKYLTLFSTALIPPPASALLFAGCPVNRQGSEKSHKTSCHGVEGQRQKTFLDVLFICLLNMLITVYLIQPGSHCGYSERSILYV